MVIYLIRAERLQVGTVFKSYLGICCIRLQVIHGLVPGEWVADILFLFYGNTLYGTVFHQGFELVVIHWGDIALSADHVGIQCHEHQEYDEEVPEGEGELLSTPWFLLSQMYTWLNIQFFLEFFFPILIVFTHVSYFLG